MSDTAGETPQFEEPEDDDPTCWVREPTESKHGVRVVDHHGLAFIEQVDGDGNERQSLMIDEEEVETLAAVLNEVTERHE